MRTLVLIAALLFATSAYAEQRSLSGSEKPAETTKSDAKASEARSEAKSDDKKKPVAKKRETDEEKARRIAKRYGVTW